LLTKISFFVYYCVVIVPLILRMSTAKKNTAVTFANIISFILIGLSLGWLIGLSVSPVLHIIVGSIITLLISLISVLGGISSVSKFDKEPRSDQINLKVPTISNINLILIALFTITLAIGASLGTYNRTNDKLGLYPDNLINKWSQDSTVRVRLKEELFKKLYLETVIESKENQLTAGLFRLTVEDCELLTLKKGEDLRSNLLLISNGKIDLIIKDCNSDECLQEIKKMICDEY